MYVSENKSKAILFNYQLQTRRKDIFSRVKLQGLDPQKNTASGKSTCFLIPKLPTPIMTRCLQANTFCISGLTWRLAG
ncbi:GH36 C-terminal domain-containing protein [Paraflavitalea speifideaquila]|uniref:GH36 C-terminal domain-containing protein n=1 Tax=Paraflavitalea speifideaquila TaxID=3076558 RepID=UPI0028EA8FC7|nr:GH36 C-terminal domain-containing protein [Paraflavitalea speifideiaquila]